MDPTNKHKNRLINILRRIKSEGRLEEGTYKKMYPTGASSPKLYGLPKIHKKEIALRPIVSSQGSVYTFSIGLFKCAIMSVPLQQVHVFK